MATFFHLIKESFSISRQLKIINGFKQKLLDDSLLKKDDPLFFC